MFCKPWDFDAATKLPWRDGVAFFPPRSSFSQKVWITFRKVFLYTYSCQSDGQNVMCILHVKSRFELGGFQ